MICTKETLIPTKSFSTQESNLKQKQSLIASWQTVNDKLICQWVNS